MILGIYLWVVFKLHEILTEELFYGLHYDSATQTIKLSSQHPCALRKSHPLYPTSFIMTSNWMSTVIISVMQLPNILCESLIVLIGLLAFLGSFSIPFQLLSRKIWDCNKYWSNLKTDLMCSTSLRLNTALKIKIIMSHFNKLYVISQ